ncbi:MAG: hypothetical protein QW711_02150 [Candidatus Korarchaeum sp.]
MTQDLLREIPILKITGFLVGATGFGILERSSGDIDCVLPFDERKQLEATILSLGFEKVDGGYTLCGYFSEYRRGNVILEVLYSPYYERLPDDMLIEKEWRYAYYNLFPRRSKIEEHIKGGTLDVKLFMKILKDSPYRELVGWYFKRMGLLEEVHTFARPLPIALFLTIIRNLKRPGWLFLLFLNIPLKFKKRISIYGL